LLVANLSRLDEKEDTDSQGVFHILGVLENLLSFMPPLAEQIVENTTLLPWLLKRVSQKAYDSNKQYASEILSIILQEGRSIALKVGELEGVDTFLQIVAVRHIPLSMEKTNGVAIQKEGSGKWRRSRIHGEYFQLLVLITGRTRNEESIPGSRRSGTYGHLDEVSLYFTILNICSGRENDLMSREKLLAKTRAIKVLSYAMQTEAGAANCEKFVEVLGLKTFFPAFMGKVSCPISW
jgi:beta-catenin-like protein 1